MSGIKYFLKCLFNINWKAMFDTADYISKKTKRNKLLILIDMIYCSVKFKAGYNDYKEFEFYLISNEKRATYLTRCLNNSIVKRYNSKKEMEILDNKSIFNEMFSEFVKRDWIDLNSHNYTDLKKFCENKSSIIAKPSYGQCGNGVIKVSINEDTDYKELYNKLISDGENLVEEVIIQDEEMASLNPTSVNSLRIFTFCDENGANILQTILKIGNGGSVDNFYNGGMYTFVNEDGKVIVPAIDKRDNTYDVHPISEKKIIGFTVPRIKEAELLVKKAAEKIPQVGYIGWDVAIGENGPQIIEGNSYPGIFQPRASFSESKEGILPRYREFMRNIKT